MLCSDSEWAQFDWYRTTRAVVTRLNESEVSVTSPVLSIMEASAPAHWSLARGSGTDGSAAL